MSHDAQATQEEISYYFHQLETMLPALQMQKDTHITQGQAAQRHFDLEFQELKRQEHQAARIGNQQMWHFTQMQLQQLEAQYHAKERSWRDEMQGATYRLQQVVTGIDMLKKLSAQPPSMQLAPAVDGFGESYQLEHLPKPLRKVTQKHSLILQNK